MRMAWFLGKDIHELLASEPFAGWSVRRSVDTDLPRREVWYEFDGHGVEVICDHDERIRAIFLHRGAGEVVSDVDFGLSRERVVGFLGAASASGRKTMIPGLGERGAWDRFAMGTTVMHVQYRLEVDAIELITLMRSDVVP